MSKILTRKDSHKKNFALVDQPVAYVISIHMSNMFATYGTKKVKHILKELYNIDVAKHISSDQPQEGAGGVDAACPGETIVVRTFTEDPIKGFGMTVQQFQKSLQDAVDELEKEEVELADGFNTRGNRD